MRVVKLVSALFAVMAFVSFAASTASAAETLWLLLPGANKTSISGKSEKATLQIKGGSTITCSSSTTEKGEITSEQTLGLVTVVFSSCTAFGLPAETEGAGSGKIVVHVEIHDCVIKASDAGILFLILPIVIKIPSVGLTINVRGSFVGLISPNKSKKTGPFTLTIEQKEGKQTIEKCEGGTAETLESSVDGGAFTQSGEEAKGGTVTFGAEEEIMV